MQATAMNDEELILRIKGGDAQSLDVLVRAYLHRTYRKVQMLVPAEDAEDVTQDIFLNLVRSIDNFEGKSAFATWFNRIILNRVDITIGRVSDANGEPKVESPGETGRNSMLKNTIRRFSGEK